MKQAGDEDVGEPSLVLVGGSPESELLGVKLRTGQGEQGDRGLFRIQPCAAACLDEEFGGRAVAARVPL